MIRLLTNWGAPNRKKAIKAAGSFNCFFCGSGNGVNQSN